MPEVVATGWLNSIGLGGPNALLTAAVYGPPSVQVEETGAWVAALLQAAALHCPGVAPDLRQTASQVLGPCVEQPSSGGAPATAAQEGQPNAAAAAAVGAQLPSAAAWREQVERGLLPQLEQAARAHASRPVPAEQQEEVERQWDDVQVARARALALRSCANLACTNLMGVSEAECRGHRCSACRTVRYCGRECSVADWPRHRPACRLLQARAAGQASTT